MAKEVEASDQRFEKLVEAIQEERISENNTKRSIKRIYGEPILSEEKIIEEQEFEVWLYRYAKKFFGSDKVYMYFDSSGKLKRWEYVKAKGDEDVQIGKETTSEIPGP